MMACKTINGKDDTVRPIVTIMVTNLETGEQEKIFALLDTGSDRDFLSYKTANRLGLTFRKELMDITTLRGPGVELRDVADIKVQSVDGSYECDVSGVIIGHLPVVESDIPPIRRDVTKNGKENLHLSDIVFDDAEEGSVDAVISIAHAAAYLFPLEWRRGGPRELAGIKTLFGWTVVGIAGKKGKSSMVSNWISTDNTNLRTEMEKVFNADFPPESKNFNGMSKEQKDAKRQLDESVHWDIEKGKFSVALPFKGGREKAMKELNGLDSRAMALKRLESMKRNFQRNPEKKAFVFGEMRKLIDEKRVEEITDDYDAAKATKPVWYLPIHVAKKHGKCRLCMDARACVNGLCLNHYLIGTLNYLIPIQRPIREFRNPIYGATFDIKAFFHQVLVNLEDSECFRFFFFEDEAMGQRKLYKFIAHIFGAASSPTVTAFVLQYHAEKVRKFFSEYVIETIKHHFYVDDGGGGANTPEGYRQFKTEMDQAMELGGFPLGKWKYSHPELLGEPTPTEEESKTKFLGIRWNLKDDTLSVAVEDFEVPQVKTVRDVVKVGAKIFDFEGWFIPFIVTGRGLTQVVMSVKGWAWDKLIKPEHREQFMSWASDIKHLARYFIPRCWNTPATVGIPAQLHIFSDASEFAYGAVAYRVVKGTDGVIQSHIITSKGHVVPTNPSRASHHNIMHRLELVGCVKSLDIRKNCEEVAREAEKIMGRKFERTVMWTDSTGVLKEIFDTTTPLKGFTGNRISRIQDETTTEEWRFVPGSINPADLITRGIKVNEPEKWAIFHKGPDFLRMEENFWPEMIVNRYPTPPEPISSYATTGKSIPLLTADIVEEAEKRSVWFNKIFRITAAVRAAKIWRQKARRKRATKLWENYFFGLERQEKDEWEEVEIKEVSGVVLRASEEALIRAIQDKHFFLEKREMKKRGIFSPLARKELPGKSKLASVNPFIDSEGIIRVGSRLVHANIDEEAKFPAVLPHDDVNIKALIRQVHHEEQHAGPGHTLVTLRQRYWILNGPRAVKKVLDICMACQKGVKKPAHQKMAALPLYRVFDTHPWDTTGVDIMGPFTVKKTGSRANHKNYVAVFTCFQTRSVHVEVVQRMDADSFINALIRFSARRPGVRHLYSDNGSNFIGSFNILSKRAKEWESRYAPTGYVTPVSALKKLEESARAKLLVRGVDWTFLPPYASHYAGVWERVIGLFKKHLAKVTSGEILHEDVFHTTIIQLEGILNDRPLYPASANPADPQPIRPRDITNPAAAGFDSTQFVVGDN